MTVQHDRLCVDSFSLPLSYWRRSDLTMLMTTLWFWSQLSFISWAVVDLRNEIVWRIFSSLKFMWIMSAAIPQPDETRPISKSSSDSRWWKVIKDFNQRIWQTSRDKSVHIMSPRSRGGRFITDVLGKTVSAKLKEDWQNWKDQRGHHIFAIHARTTSQEEDTLQQRRLLWQMHHLSMKQMRQVRWQWINHKSR